MQLKQSMKYVIIAYMRNITIINGAGISVNAGISAFRGTTGAWTTEPDVRNAFNLNVFMTKPKARALLWDWLAHSPAWNAEPTIAHQEIKRLNDNKALLGVFTQNFDGLEAKTGLDTDRIIICMGTCLQVPVNAAAGNMIHAHYVIIWLMNRNRIAMRGMRRNGISARNHMVKNAAASSNLT